ncbi:MAG: patatin-like phospholipase family protein [Deltaproteobacteria bacterium]|nr:patatin-like phospholipase family protein [Deltaproteobacteria bacterium]
METVLLFGADPGSFQWPSSARTMGEGEIHIARSDGSLLALIFENDINRASRRIAARTIDAAFIDGRAPRERLAEALLERMFPPHDAAGLVRRGRTLVAVDATEAGVELARRAGHQRLASVLLSPNAKDVFEAVERLFAAEKRGRIALCLAGGGIEGLLYELGVVRAMDEFFVDRHINDFDLFFGISAGSILGALLANGLHPAEIADGLRRGNHRLDRITRGDIFDPNFAGILRQLGGFTKDLLGRGESRNIVSAAYRAIPSGAFAGDALRKYMQRQLQRPGMSDSFHSLRRPLFVGATDQDTGEAVVFGEPGFSDVPVHLAVRASSALVPFYAPQKIAGRYYIDGAFTRTTNMRVAAKHGATLAIVVDPLVPLHSEESGYVNKRGGLFGAMQGLKCLINGRFDKAEGSIREMFPDVAFHLFRPEGDEMRILSGSPMKFLYREEVEQLAYERTRRKLLARESVLARDFARHGWIFRAPPARRQDTLAFGPIAQASV